MSEKESVDIIAERAIALIRKEFFLPGKLKAGVFIGGVTAFLVATGFIGYRAAFSQIQERVEAAVQTALAKESFTQLSTSAKRAATDAETAAAQASEIVGALSLLRQRWDDSFLERSSLRLSDFAIVDTAGRTRIHLRVDSQGFPIVSLLDERGAARLELRSETDGLGRVVMMSSSQRVIATLAEATPAGMALTFLDDDGTPRLALITDTNGASTIFLADAKGKQRAQLGFDDSGHAALAFSDPAGVLRVQLGFSPDSPAGAELRLKDDQGRIRAALGFIDDNPTLVLMDSRERVRAQVIVDKEGEAYFVGLDEDGKAKRP